jgi:hypothetical protein
MEADDFEAILRAKYFYPVDVLKLDQGRPRVFDRWAFKPKPITDSFELRLIELQLKTLAGTI